MQSYHIAVAGTEYVKISLASCWPNTITLLQWK